MEERIADPDLKELICPVTGMPMKPVFEEKIEVLARKPAEYWVRVIVRQVFASPEGDADGLQPVAFGGHAPAAGSTASVIGSILCARFADHQPYNRQSDQLARHGVKLDPGHHRFAGAAGGRKARMRLRCSRPSDARLRFTLMMDPTPVRLKSDAKRGSTKEALPVDLPRTGPGRCSSSSPKANTAPPPQILSNITKVGYRPTERATSAAFPRTRTSST